MKEQSKRPEEWVTPDGKPPAKGTEARVYWELVFGDAYDVPEVAPVQTANPARVTTHSPRRPPRLPARMRGRRYA